MLNRSVARLLPFMPRSLVGAVARRYIAGEDIEAARRTVVGLLEHGFAATVDVLGEDVTEPADADRSVDDYMELIEAIPAWTQRDGDARVSVSLKPTMFGLRFDPDGTRERLRHVVGRAAEHGIFVRLDMEDATTTDANLALYRELRERHPGLVGCVLQAMLFRTRVDAATLAAESGHDVRLCKGIYQEPATIAWQEHQGVRDNFLHVAAQLLGGGVRTRLATHDLWIVDRLRVMTIERDADPADVEFQALLGVPIQRTLADLKDVGHPVRLYVPYGRAWYAYSLRRLRENPKVVGHVIRGMFSGQR